MSQVSSKIILRQWHIVLFLLRHHYVSTKEIMDHLVCQGIAATQRTVQRDLLQLEQIFPLDCRRDSLPYSWRWRRNAHPVAGLNLKQAVILSLVEEELSQLIPPHILQELAPLFKRARLICSTNLSIDEEQTLKSTLVTERFELPEMVSLLKQSI